MTSGDPMGPRTGASRTPRVRASPGPRAGIDWAEVRRRVEAARAAVERASAPGPEETRRILKERARALAGAPAREDDEGTRVEVVEFLLAHERYAVESRYVREVHPLENLMPLPCTPAFVLGIVNLRGEILPVIDIKRFFDLPERGLTDLDKIIVLNAGDMTVGVLADSVIGVRAIAEAAIQAPLPTLTGIREDYLKGVGPDRVVVLDAARLLADRRIVVDEEVGG